MQKRFQASLPFLALALMTITGLSPAAARVAVRPPAACGPSWTAVHIPHQGVTDSIDGVSALTSTDAWAVGSYSDSVFPGAPSTPVTLHWNGARWHLVPSVPVANGLLTLVEAISPKDVWAAGTESDENGSTPLFEHWNGKRWSRAPAPSLTTSLFLPIRDLSASSGDDLWAVGSIADFHERTLIFHWNGHAWREYPRRALGNLQSVVAISPTDAWAVGSEGEYPISTLTVHWDGTSWSIVESPDPGDSSNYLNGVGAVSPTDVWAGGYYAQNATPEVKSLLMHWDGNTWSAVPGDEPFLNDHLYDVDAWTGGDAWALGWGSRLHGGRRVGLSEHWDGSSWGSVPPVGVKGGSSPLYRVSVSSGGDVWAIGYLQRDGNADRGLIEHICPEGRPSRDGQAKPRP